ncbi:hypothetical protein JN11_03764 [Mucilaginibacter frigoritolerans]|uniref:Putative auto-transporter adhesin head GIN domain-containing protein n=1 Tax=Mucilaginibacter frigoritolerans TaxID=652788 RepID=A0A562TT90_9SPHI|nr:DUF2807 domain-containing protein [Mucilaginibacter frigoritolerans]TWI96653.1 hypothetical protein JN11_03764 [Mucilaginibacter frigoritolerans]
MKTTFLKIATVLLILTAGTKTFAANPGSNQELTELTWINKFYKIEVHGNVRLHLLSGEKNGVQMSGTYYDHDALVEIENGVLRITCYSAERLDVWVTVYDLNALTAYDDVLVKTEGRFSSLDLDIELYDKAKADLNLDCCFIHIKLNDSSLANISGTAIESELAVNYASTLNSTNFIAAQMLKKRMDPAQRMPVEFNTNFYNKDNTITESAVNNG